MDRLVRLWCGTKTGTPVQPLLCFTPVNLHRMCGSASISPPAHFPQVTGCPLGSWPVLISNMLPSVSACICAEHLGGWRQLKKAVSLMLINTPGTDNPPEPTATIRWNKSPPSRKCLYQQFVCMHDSAARIYCKWWAHINSSDGCWGEHKRILTV